MASIRCEHCQIVLESRSDICTADIFKGFCEGCHKLDDTCEACVQLEAQNVQLRIEVTNLKTQVAALTSQVTFLKAQNAPFMQH